MPAGLGGPEVWAFWKVWEGWEVPGSSRPGGGVLGAVGAARRNAAFSPAFDMEDWIPGLSGGEGAGEA